MSKRYTYDEAMELLINGHKMHPVGYPENNYFVDVPDENKIGYMAVGCIFIQHFDIRDFEKFIREYDEWIILRHQGEYNMTGKASTMAARKASKSYSLSTTIPEHIADVAAANGWHSESELAEYLIIEGLKQNNRPKPVKPDLKPWETEKKKK